MFFQKKRADTSRHPIATCLPSADFPLPGKAARLLSCRNQFIVSRLIHLYMDNLNNLKDMKDEVLVVTNASDGNKPHVVERIEQDGSLKTQPLAKAKPDGDFLRIDRSESILEAFFSNFKTTRPTSVSTTSRRNCSLPPRIWRTCSASRKRTRP